MNKRTWIWVLWWAWLVLVAGTLLFPLYKFLRWIFNGYFYKIVSLSSAGLMISVSAWLVWYNRNWFLALDGVRDGSPNRNHLFSEG